jgi:hypothetical protein
MTSNFVVPPNPQLSAIHGLKRVVCEVDAVGQNAQNEIVEGVRQIWTLAAHTFEIGAGQSEQGGRAVRRHGGGARGMPKEAHLAHDGVGCNAPHT